MKVYKDGKTRTIHPIDAQGWIADGWSTQSPVVDQDQPNPQTTKDKPDRLTELKAMSWQELQSLAEKYSLEKPEGVPWKVFAEEIAKHEQTLPVQTQAG
ncbi:MAG: hypothetical protein F6K21_03315 [Symploca sp. SIO2D2]|nr:hypothetical protein [Symploca sp. SIO2D2]